MTLSPPSADILKIQTARLDLEPVTEGHAEEMCELFSDPKLHEFVPFTIPTLQLQRERCERWSKRLSPKGDEVWLNWVSRHRGTGKVMGHFQAGYKDLQIASIGYVVAREFQGQGLAFEALEQIFHFLGNVLLINEVRAWTDTRNVASHKLATKLGMKQIEFIKNADFFHGSASDELVFARRLR